MTDEERKKLCDELSQLHVSYSDAPERAVAEIKRLAKEVEEWKRLRKEMIATHEREIVIALGGREHPSRRW